MAQKTKVPLGFDDRVDPDFSVAVHRPFPRVQKHFTRPSKTRQSEIASVDLKSIVRRYQQAGALPPSSLQFADVSNLPKDRLEAMNVISDALEAFQDLPLKVRQAVGHDPRLLEEWIRSNPQLAVEAGLLIPQDSPKSSSPKAPASSSGAGEAKDKPTAKAGGEVEA